MLTKKIEIKTCFKHYLICLCLFIVILNQIQIVKSAVCKGCSPPCICPGIKGEKVIIFYINFKILF